MCDLVQRLIAENENSVQVSLGSDIFYKAAERISFLEKQIEENKITEFRKYLSQMEEWYIEQHKMIDDIDADSSDKRIALFCGHLIQKIDEF